MAVLARGKCKVCGVDIRLESRGSRGNIWVHKTGWNKHGHAIPKHTIEPVDVVKET